MSLIAADPGSDFILVSRGRCASGNRGSRP
jgi:hypothetical protein